MNDLNSLATLTVMFIFSFILMQKGVAVFKKYIKYALKTSYSLTAGVRELKGLFDIQIHDFKTIIINKAGTCPIRRLLQKRFS